MAIHRCNPTTAPRELAGVSTTPPPVGPRWVRWLVAGAAAWAVLAIISSSAQAATVSADFNAREIPKLKVGFLHNLSASAPSDGLLLPLKPTAWRSSTGSASEDRVRGLGARQTIVLSDHWSYPAHKWPSGTPWSQPERYADWVRQFARRFKGHGHLYWDIWNEPDYKLFWDGTRAQFYETFAIAERVLREELGQEASIVGPSTTRWRPDWIKGLAEFCLRRGCRFDAVSWHDLPNDLRSLPRLSDRVERTRKLLARPRYRSLGVAEVHVNEIMGQGIQFMPGAAVSYFSELERAQADVAIKSCWPDSSGRDSCAGQTLDGLLDWNTGRPRALWHTWRAYAEGRSSRVRSNSRDPRIAVLASRRSHLPGRAQLLLGNIGSPRRSAMLRLCGLSALTPGHTRPGRVAAVVEGHPDVGEAVFTPTLDSRPYRFEVDDDGRCANGRLPLPSERGALVAYIQVR